MAGKKSYTFANPPAPKKTPGGAGKRRGLKFATPPETPTLRATLEYGGTHNGFPEAPAQSCDCGGQHATEVRDGQDFYVTLHPQAPGCLYDDWPARVLLDVPLATHTTARPERDKRGYLLHPCPDCGAFGKAAHTYTCPYWDRNLDAVPF